MLFKEAHLRGIRSGAVGLAFRKWGKASVQKGSLLKTPVGLVEIVSVSVVREEDITETDVKNAGFETRDQLLKSLSRHDSGSIYKIGVRYYAEDPRIGLREQTALTDEKYAELKARLERLDNYSRQGDWTGKVLGAVRENPGKKAMELSRLLGCEKEWLKLNIRKLKNLGLTLSGNSGYELSPLGRTFTAMQASGK